MIPHNPGKIVTNEERENGDNQSHDKKHISTNAYICDLENKANFSEAAFTASYPYHCV